MHGVGGHIAAGHVSAAEADIRVVIDTPVPLIGTNAPKEQFALLPYRRDATTMSRGPVRYKRAWAATREPTVSAASSSSLK